MKIRIEHEKLVCIILWIGVINYSSLFIANTVNIYPTFYVYKYPNCALSLRVSIRSTSGIFTNSIQQTTKWSLLKNISMSIKCNCYIQAFPQIQLLKSVLPNITKINESSLWKCSRNVKYNMENINLYDELGMISFDATI